MESVAGLARNTHDHSSIHESNRNQAKTLVETNCNSLAQGKGSKYLAWSPTLTHVGVSFLAYPQCSPLSFLVELAVNIGKCH